MCVETLASLKYEYRVACLCVLAPGGLVYAGQLVLLTDEKQN